MESPGSFLRQLRRQLLAFVLSSSRRLNLSPIVKYTALTFFADRFLPSLERYKLDSRARNWLLQPLTESNLQLFVLVSVWIASKIHDTRPLSVKSLKTFADDIIQDQHFTTRDIVDAELVFMKVLRFDIGAMNITVIFLEELLSQFKEVAKAGDIMSISSCMDIMDLLYETEEMSKLYKYPHSLAVSVLVASYVMGVPAQRSEFPLLPWVKLTTSYKEEDIAEIVRSILEHVLEPTMKARGFEKAG
ncbi:cyclin-J18-like isoform X2 [Aristolochia californica]|uniref:cyclin-J18-like isoform X2 n=1 Tax=Aristolochia californica TaxID=171875 RepID=UPI0035DD5E6F